MKRLLINAVVASTLLGVQFGHACSIGTILYNSGAIAESKLECFEPPKAKHQTAGLSKTTFGDWVQLNTNTRTATSGETNHHNYIWAFPFRHTCAIEYRFIDHNGSRSGFGWSGDLFCF